MILKKMLLNLIAAIIFISAQPISVKAEEVYLIRGFMDIYSRGIDTMTYRLRSKGIRATSHSNGEWQNIAKDIIRRARKKRVSYPIVIVGHSLGGVEASTFASTLGRAGVPVAMVIGLDPGFNNPSPLGPGIKRVYNYKISSGKNYRRGAGFTGKITTIDVSKYGVDHVGIDKNSNVQRLVLAKIRSQIRR